MRVFTILALCFSLAFYPVFAQQGPYPVPESPKEGGGGVNIGPAIVLPLLLIPMLIKKLTEGKDLPTYPVLEKKPVNISQSGNTYTINWVIYYANNTNTTQNNISITEGPINNIVPGSLQGPTGWTGTLNSTNTVATWTGNAPPINGYMSATIPTSGPASFNPGSGSGDGYILIPYRDSGGVLRIYYINHHVTRNHSLPGSNISNAMPFGCINTSTGNLCPGFPKKLPKGDGSGKPSSTNMHPEEYFLKGTQLYYVVTTPDNPTNVNNTSWEFGLGCYDLTTDTECGFFKLGALPSGYNGEAYVKGPWKVGSELYIIDMDGKLYCLDANNPSNFCSGLGNYFTGFQLPLGAFPKPGPAWPGNDPWWGPAVAGEIYNNKLYLTTSTNPVHSTNILLTVNMTLRTFCFDTAIKGTCMGWSVLPRNITANRFISTFLYYDNSMTPRHVCARLNGSTQSCVNINSGVITTPPTIVSTLNSAYGFGSEITIGTRTYFPDFFQGTNAVHCWDWSTGSPCTPTSSYPSWTISPKNYAVNVDDKGCIWVLGDNAPAMWNFDPNKPLTQGKASRCEGKEGKQNFTFQPWQYCSGPKPFLWTKVEITNASLSDFSKLIINVKDNANNTIFTYDCLANSSLTANLSSIASQTNGQPLKVEVDYALSSSSNLQNFDVKAYYHASPLEFCLKSQHNCSQSEVKNTVSVPGVQNQPTVEVSLPKPEHCPIYAEGGGNQPSGPSSGGQSGNTGGGQDSGSGGVAPWLGGALLTPTPLPGGTGGAGGTSGTGNVGASGGASSGATGGGVQVIEKDGQVQIAPEVKQRCYWRPKAKTPTESKPVVKKKTTSTVKKATTQKPEVKSSTTQTSKPPTKPAKKVAKKPKVQPTSTQEMEYICEPEK